jgi:hypothetical protein
VRARKGFETGVGSSKLGRVLFVQPNTRSTEPYVPPTPEEQLRGSLEVVKYGLERILRETGSAKVGHVTYMNVHMRVDGEESTTDGGFLKRIPELVEWIEARLEGEERS